MAQKITFLSSLFMLNASKSGTATKPEYQRLVLGCRVIGYEDDTPCNMQKYFPEQTNIQITEHYLALQSYSCLVCWGWSYVQRKSTAVFVTKLHIYFIRFLKKNV